ncbi:hypothetical protein [Massilia psychrophila]|jgi:hypothetical protein|uniref:Uncharacterized protein n=1 Tax=Massilia psychrophila TaxID=1603353 RepID=A0A2G8T4J7_9BURK|nr:hypothetical protein [Massilia psychrophila]PIL40977.1 hypothetical protein CR103_04350 [Massilia psychrophila]GGE68826.1 hypothetical protein GCM10008020_11520 [Massilia psychrophila]
MNIRKNAEAFFLAAAIVGTFGTFVSYATAAEPARFTAAAVVTPFAAKVIASDSTMQVVVIKGQRLSAAQKAALN